MSGPKTSRYTLTPEQRRILAEQRRIERRKYIDSDKHMVRVDKYTWLLLSDKNNNKRYIANWRKLANRDKGCLAAKVDGERMGVEED